MYYLYECLIYAKVGYIISSILVLLFSLFISRLKVILRHYLEISNRIGLTVAWLYLLFNGGWNIYSYFFDDDWSIQYWKMQAWLVGLSVIFIGFPTLLFLKKRFGHSIVVTCIVISLLVLDFCDEGIFKLLFFTNSDTLPSSWSYYISYFDLIGLPLISTLIYFGVVLLLLKRKAALQQPSVVK